MKNTGILLLSMSCLFIFGQELDEAYLESLPADIRDDLIDRADKKTADSKNNYRSSLYSSKLEQAEDLIKLKSRIENDLDELQRRLNSDEEVKLNKGLLLFGSDFFDSFQTSFMPINEPNPDASYILDTGDVLKIQLIGQENYIEKFIVGKDGSVNLPDVGQLTVAGLSLNNASQLIKSRVNEAFIGTDAFVSIDNLRDVNILVSGNAQKPGIYTLTGNSNVLHALTVAGGVSDYGSFREINLIRDNEIIETLDVYELLLGGTYDLKSRLRSGDVVFVEPRKKVAAIDGAVIRPALYELKEDEYLGSLLLFSNGLKHTADYENIFLERILDGKLKSIPIVNITQFDSIVPQYDDMIYVREFSYRSATITGAVYKPGTYTMAAGETVDNLITKAGGYTKNAYPFGAVYETKNARAINEKALEMLYQEFLDNIISLSQLNVGQDFDLTPIIKLTKEIKNSKASGRIVVDLINSNKAQNVSEGDTIVIPEITSSVYVYGEVSSEGGVSYEKNQGLEYYIKKSGGYKKFADNASIYILHPNGETERYKNKRNLFASQPSQLDIYPGSVIFVPRKLDSSATNRLATQAYVSILGNLGIALASLSSINND